MRMGEFVLNVCTASTRSWRGEAGPKCGVLRLPRWVTPMEESRPLRGATAMPASESYGAEPFTPLVTPPSEAHWLSSGTQDFSQHSWLPSIQVHARHAKSPSHCLQQSSATLDQSACLRLVPWLFMPTEPEHPDGGAEPFRPLVTPSSEVHWLSSGTQDFSQHSWLPLIQVHARHAESLSHCLQQFSATLDQSACLKLVPWLFLPTEPEHPDGG